MYYQVWWSDLQRKGGEGGERLEGTTAESTEEGGLDGDGIDEGQSWRKRRHFGFAGTKVEEAGQTGHVLGFYWTTYHGE